MRTIPTKPIMAEHMAERVAPADRAHHRGLGRRRLGQDHRDDGRVQPARRHRHPHAATSIMTDNLAHGAGGGAGAGLGRRARRGAAGGQPLLGDDQGTSAMFVAGPPVVARARPGSSTSRSSAAGRSRCRAGAVDHAVETEEEAFECARRFLSYLPSSVYGAAAAASAAMTTRAARGDAVQGDPARPAPGLQDAADHRGGGRQGLASSRWAQMFGRSIITGLARLDGLPVAVLASDPYPLRRRLDGGRLPEDRALRRSGRDLPPAGRLSVRLPGLPDRARGGEVGHHPPRRARDGGDQPVAACRGAR